jgi:hypothetical protein
MSLDKLLAAAITYFETGAELHRVLAAAKPTPITYNTAEPATKKVAKKAVDTPSVTDVIESVKAEGAPTAVEKAPEPAAIQLPDAVEQDLDEGAPSETAVNYETDIRPLIRSKSLSNRDGVVKLLSSFSVKAGSELTTAQYGLFLAGLQAL